MMKKQPNKKKKIVKTILSSFEFSKVNPIEERINAPIPKYR